MVRAEVAAEFKIPPLLIASLPIATVVGSIGSLGVVEASGITYDIGQVRWNTAGSPVSRGSPVCTA